MFDSRLHLAVTALLLLPGFSSAAEHLILCPADLADEFQVLADHRTSAGVPSTVVTVEDVLSTARPGRDDAETIRNYLVDTHAQGELRYVLLGGDRSLIPSRTIRSTLYPAGSGTDLDVDLYFAGLDGDWDADGDGVFGEPWDGASEDDAADLDPDVALGRAPVADSIQARRFVDGVIAYDTTSDAAFLGRALLLAEVLFPDAWTPGSAIALDGATYARAIGSRLEAHPAPIARTERFENLDYVPTPLPLTRAATLAELNSGTHGFVYFVGHAGTNAISVGDALVETDDVLALVNAPNYAVHVNLAWGASSLAEAGVNTALVTAPDGGASAVFGFSDAMFPVAARDFTEAIVDALAASTAVPVGDAWVQVLADRVDAGQVNSASRWTSQVLLLFGDPAMPFRAEEQPVSVDEPGVGPDPVDALGLGIEVLPNPVGNVSSVRFSVPREARTSVRVFDVRGRAVDTLYDGRVIGTRTLVWTTDGLPSGIYFVRVESAGRIVTEKVAITR